MDAGALHLALTSCRQAWAVRQADGPASRWPRLAPGPKIAAFCRDRQGMGVPAESLPMALACYSVCGWTPAVREGKIVLEAGCPEPVNGEGCRRYLAIQTQTAADAFLAWTKMQAVLAEMEAYQPRLSRESQKSRESLGSVPETPNPSLASRLSATKNQSPSRTSFPSATADEKKSLASRLSATESRQAPQRRPKWTPKVAKLPASKP